MGTIKSTIKSKITKKKGDPGTPDPGKPPPLKRDSERSAARTPDDIHQEYQKGITDRLTQRSTSSWHNSSVGPNSTATEESIIVPPRDFNIFSHEDEHDTPSFENEDRTRKFPIEKARILFKTAIGKSALLKDTPDELKEELFEQAAIPVFVNDKDTLFDQGISGHLFFVLLDGKFQGILNRSGKKKSKTFGRGVAVAEHCVLMNSPHEFSLTALSDGVVLAVHRIQFQLTAVHFADKARLEKKVNETLTEDMETQDINLATIPIFAPLTKSQLDNIKKAFKLKTFNFNERILASKQTIPGLYIIKSGQVAVRSGKHSSDTSAFSWQAKTDHLNQTFMEAEYDEIEWLQRGDYFGEASLLGGDAQLGVDVVCSNQKGVQLLLLEYADFKSILKADEMLSATEKSIEHLLDALKIVHVNRLMNRSTAFSDLAESQIDALCKLITFKTFTDKERIVEGGMPVTNDGGMYLVTQGAVRLVPFVGLKHTKSLHDLEQRAKILRQNSKGVGKPSQINEESETSSSTLGDVGRGQSFMGLNPQLFGTQMSMHLQADDLAPMLETDGSDPGMNTSLDHEALFASLGVPDRDYVVLLAGELFGEEGIKQDENERIAKASIYAIGKVTCAYIPLSLLQRLFIDDIVRSSIFEETEESKPSTNNFKANAETLARLNHARRISTTYLNDDAIRKEERRAQQHSLTRGPKRESLTFRLTAKRLLEIKPLHQTDVVHVCLSLHDPSKQVLVVKELNVTAANKQGMGAYVLSEQVVLAQISSGFVANMISSWEEPERLFLGLEPALVGDLGQLLSQAKANPDSDSYPKIGELGGFNFEFLQFVAACGVMAMKHLYEHHVIHRDIKPNNIVVDVFGYCKLVDFGIAKRLVSGSSRTYSLLGSPKYMAPELVELAFKGSGQPYTSAVDWWAFGITLYELATCHLPYRKPDDKKASDRDMNEDALMKVQAYKRENGSSTHSVIFEKDSWFEPFRNQTGNDWRNMGKFITKLLIPNPDFRLGSSSTRGPREAMDQPVFTGIKFFEIARKTFPPPFIPKTFMIDLEEMRAKAERGQYPCLTAHREVPPQAAPRPKLQRSTNVETRVRADLEHPDNNNEKMAQAMESTDQARKQMIMAREQHIRRLAFKQGCTLDELDSKNSLKNNKLVVLQRAAVLETLQVFVEGGGNSRVRRAFYATQIQAFWRGARARMLVKKMRAVRTITKFLRRVQMERNSVRLSTNSPQKELRKETSSKV